MKDFLCLQVIFFVFGMLIDKYKAMRRIDEGKTKEICQHPLDRYQVF